MTTEEKIEVMQGYIDGKQIQVRYRQYYMLSEWSDCTLVPTWDWSTREYRIKPQPTRLEVANEVWEKTFSIKNAFDNKNCPHPAFPCYKCLIKDKDGICSKKQWWSEPYEEPSCKGE